MPANKKCRDSHVGLCTYESRHIKVNHLHFTFLLKILGDTLQTIDPKPLHLILCYQQKEFGFW